MRPWPQRRLCTRGDQQWAGASGLQWKMRGKEMRRVTREEVGGGWIEMRPKKMRRRGAQACSMLAIGWLFARRKANGKGHRRYSDASSINCFNSTQSPNLAKFAQPLRFFFESKRTREKPISDEREGWEALVLYFGGLSRWCCCCSSFSLAAGAELGGGRR
jgi:hypothetical protein